MTIYMVECVSNWCGDVDTCTVAIYTSMKKAEKYLKKELIWAKERPENYHSRGSVIDGYLSKVVITALPGSGNTWTKYYVIPKEIE